MTITFHNVTLTIDSASARQAYNDLCEHLELYDRKHGRGAIEWQTDTYSIDDGPERDTRDLWPK